MKLTERQIKRHRRAFAFFKRLLGGWICRKYGYSYEPAVLPDTACIVLANHNAELDPIILGLAIPHSYFVASEHLFNKGFLSRLLVRYFAPIPRMKGRADAMTVLDLRRRLAQGCNIAIFPEGNRSLDGRTMPPHPSTGALVRSCKVPVVIFKFEGAYLTNPRWSVSVRKGRMTGRVVNIHYPEQLAGMTDDEVNSLIYKELYEDAYEAQAARMIPFCGKNLVVGLETALFLCPICKRIGRLKSGGNYLFCECGMKTEYNKYGYFVGGALPFNNYTEWYDWQKDELVKRAEDTYTRFTVSDGGLEVYRINNNRVRERLAFTHIKMNAQQLILSGDGNQIAFENQSITGMSIYSRNSIVLEARQDYYEIKAGKDNPGFNARKYLHLYEYAKPKNEQQPAFSPAGIG